MNAAQIQSRLYTIERLLKTSSQISIVTELAGQIIKVGEFDYTDLNIYITSRIAIYISDAKPENKLFVRGYFVIDEAFAEDYYYEEDHNIINIEITEEPVKGSNIPNSNVRNIKCMITLDGNNQDWVQGKASIYIEVVPFPTLTE